MMDFILQINLLWKIWDILSTFLSGYISFSLLVFLSITNFFLVRFFFANLYKTGKIVSVDPLQIYLPLET